jgi:hypothetical protein
MRITDICVSRNNKLLVGRKLDHFVSSILVSTAHELNFLLKINCLCGQKKSVSRSIELKYFCTIKMVVEAVLSQTLTRTDHT